MTFDYTFADFDSLVISEPTGIEIIDAYQDTLVLYFIGLFDDETVDVREPAQVPMVEVYPNPTRDILQLQIPSSISNPSTLQASIYTTQGKQVLQSILSDGRLSVDFLPQGLYIGTLRNQDQKMVGTFRFVVE